MNYPDVTLRCMKSHLYHVVFISTCNDFFYPFYVRFIIVLQNCIHCLFPLFTCTFVTCDI